MSATAAELAPCPWCADGGQPHHWRPPEVQELPLGLDGQPVGQPLSWVECRQCLACGPASQDPTLAASIWGLRAVVLPREVAALQVPSE